VKQAMKKTVKQVDPRISVFLFSKEKPTGQIFKFHGGKESEEYKEMLDNGWFDTPAKLDLPKEDIELTTEQVERMRPEDLIGMLQSYGFIVLTPEQLKAEVTKLTSAHIDIKEFTDEALIAEAVRRGLKEGGEIVTVDSEHSEVFKLGQETVETDGSENFINTSDINDDEDLLAKFKDDPKKLTKEEHIILGKTLGLSLRINYGEDTMIGKITEKLKEDQLKEGSLKEGLKEA
jgi:hypothetical protein